MPTTRSKFWRNKYFALCCRQALEYKSCFDAITCRESDELYQWYLLASGDALALDFLCQNDTQSGLRMIDFNDILRDECLP